MDWPIILIGPMGAGKTTIGELLAQKLGTLHLELDDRRWDYYNEIGYDQAYAAKIRAEEGFSALYRYWKPFEIHAVERVLADCLVGVISFGAGHSVYEEQALFERARCALESYANVILLLPCADPGEAAAILKERFIEVGKAEGFTPSPQTLGMIDHFLSHPSNRRLASCFIDYEEQADDFPITSRWIFKEEFQLLLRLAGFAHWEAFRTPEGDPLLVGLDETFSYWIAEK